MSAHTPGPWHALPEECDKPYVRIRGTHLGARYKIANVLTPIYAGVHKREAEETRANAHLIEAAPNLLDALYELERAEAHYRLVFQTAPSASHLDVGRAWDRMAKAGNRARSAIAQATREHA